MAAAAKRTISSFGIRLYPRDIPAKINAQVHGRSSWPPKRPDDQRPFRGRYIIALQLHQKLVGATVGPIRRLAHAEFQGQGGGLPRLQGRLPDDRLPCSAALEDFDLRLPDDLEHAVPRVGQGKHGFARRAVRQVAEVYLGRIYD